MITVIASILLLTVPGSGTEANIKLYSYALGKKYAISVTEAALNKAPAWKEGTDNPPVSARKAITSAGAVKDRLIPDTADWKWELRSASLEKWRADRWFWVVTFEARSQKVYVIGRPIELRLVVLMDGTVVEPEVSDDRPRK